MKIVTRLFPIFALCLGLVPAGSWGEPGLTDRQNYDEGVKLHQQGKYKEAYEFYFEDMTPSAKTLEWLKNYRDKYQVQETQFPVLPANMNTSTQEAQNKVAGQSLKRYIYLNLGLSVPSAPDTFSNYWKPGESFGAGFGIGFTKILDLVFDFSYNSFPFDETKFLSSNGLMGYGISVKNASVNSLLGTVNLKTKFSSHDPSVNGYITSGIGFGSFGHGDVVLTQGTTSVEALPASTDIDLAIRLGLGIDIKLNKSMKLYFETNGVDMFSQGETTSYGTLKGGLLFGLH